MTWRHPCHYCIQQVTTRRLFMQIMLRKLQNCKHYVQVQTLLIFRLFARTGSPQIIWLSLSEKHPTHYSNILQDYHRRAPLNSGRWKRKVVKATPQSLICIEQGPPICTSGAAEVTVNDVFRDMMMMIKVIITIIKHRA